ncbi:MAG: phospholipase D-like domain-containing protein [Bacteroidota bacterium]
MTEPYFKTYFSPGNECRKAICQEIKQADQSIDICVFTISDNIITHAILDAFHAGIDIRILTDNDKVNDRGSDIHFLAQKGLDIKIDHTRHHMHHKFAVFDNASVLTGSYNWTRSAADFNQENIIISNHQDAVQQFSSEFQRLWRLMEPFKHHFSA